MKPCVYCRLFATCRCCTCVYPLNGGPRQPGDKLCPVPSHGYPRTDEAIGAAIGAEMAALTELKVMRDVGYI